MTLKKWILVALIAAVVTGFIASGGSELLTLENLKENQQSLGNWIDQNLLVAVLGFVAAYIVVTALSLPGATIMTLAGGAFLAISTVWLPFQLRQPSAPHSHFLWPGS